MRTLNDDLKLNGFIVSYRRDHPGDNHGEICVNVKESICSQHRPDLEVNDVECLWIKICTKHRKFLLGTFTPASNLGYLAPPPQDNFSWVPNCSLGPPGWETKVS